MAHELDMTGGKANIAWTKEVPWHGLGKELTPDASIETWVTEAGLDWEAIKTPVQFSTPDGIKTFQGKSTIYRGDTLAPLSTVSDDFKMVQPREVIEFFKEAAGQAKMKLEVAGSLYGGKRFWATARLDAEELKLNGVDEVKPYVLLITSLDGTLATSASLVSTRVVCMNTARIALNESGKRVRVTHAATFDPNFIKADLGLLDQAWFDFKSKMVKMATTPMTDEQAFKFFLQLVKAEDVIEQPLGIRRQVDDLMYRYTKGIGAELSYGTNWGAYNAVSERITYAGRGSSDAKMMSAVYGKNNEMIQEAARLLTA